MKAKVLVLVMLGVLMVLSGIPATALTARGQVVDMEKNPVPNIKVYALVPYYTKDMQEKVSLKAAVTADDQGNWVFASLPKPTVDCRYWMYYFVAVKPGEKLGWTRGAGELISIPNALTVPKEGYTIPVAKLGTCEGQVTDKDGNPIAGATVKMGVLLEIDEKCAPGG